MAEYIDLYHASNKREGVNIKFDYLGEYDCVFEGLFARKDLRSQQKMIDKGKCIYSCSIKLSKIASKRDLKRDFDALVFVSKELRTSDKIIADIFLDLMLKPMSEHVIKIEDLVDQIVPKYFDLSNSTYEQKLKNLKFEKFRILGQLAKHQGFDAISIPTKAAEEILVVDPDVIWSKVL